MISVYRNLIAWVSYTNVTVVLYIVFYHISCIWVSKNCREVISATFRFSDHFLHSAHDYVSKLRLWNVLLGSSIEYVFICLFYKRKLKKCLTIKEEATLLPSTS